MFSSCAMKSALCFGIAIVILFLWIGKTQCLQLFCLDYAITQSVNLVL